VVPGQGGAVGLPAEPGRVTVLHTNDLHGHFLPEGAEWLDGRPAIGGFVRIDQEVRAVKAARPRDSVLLLDGGDLLTGTPLTDIEVDGSKGGAMLRFMEGVGYDAWAIGNHEFDKGIDNLAALTAQSDMPPLSANVRDLSGKAPLLPRQQFSEVFEVSGVRVGVIGATTDSLKGLMGAGDFKRLTLVQVETAVREELARLDPETDLIVVLSHIGVDADEQLARSVDGIDLIVGAHSHTRLTRARQVEDTWIVQAGSYARSLGVVDMTVEDDRIATFSYELRDLLPDTAAVEPDPNLVAMAESYKADIDGYYSQVLSSAPVTLGRDYHHESGLGRWITDVLRETTGADVALYNGGGLRADLPAGTVTRGTIYACFPFRNEVQTFELNGQELAGVLLRNAIAENDEKRGFLPVSGVTYTWRVRNNAPELVEVLVGGQPIDPARTYVIATNSYIAEQWEKHLGVKPRNLTGTGTSDFDAAMEIASRRPVEVDPAPRARRLE
jgi:2',3'-cyclic-nucleotide 2'-phosphodiesterase (5'-nucleotidase family)